MVRLIDIGANLTDGMFRGVYHGREVHRPDLAEVLSRAWNAGLERIIVTGGSLEESKQALDLAQSNSRLYSTVGCHPTRAKQFLELGGEKYLSGLKTLLEEGGEKVVALGELGLDYERLEFSSVEEQGECLREQLKLCSVSKLPLFLHCRGEKAGEDLAHVLGCLPQRPSGVVHSFTGSLTLAKAFIAAGLHIGVNGCSLKTDANLGVVKELPLECLLLETDAPWCDIRKTHAGWNHVLTRPNSVKKERWSPDAQVKGRNEPANIAQVLEVVASLKDLPSDVVASRLYANTLSLFFPRQVNY